MDYTGTGRRDEDREADVNIDRAIKNSPPPMDDVGNDVNFMLDEKVECKRQLLHVEAVNNPSNPKMRYGDKKVALHTVPPSLMIYAALAFKEGARKYGAYNWRTINVDVLTYTAAAVRHVLAYQDGEDIDPESGLPHLAHAISCLGVLADATEGHWLIDNRPKNGPAGDLIRELASKE